MSRSLLCETVTGGTMADLLAARDAATDADLVELRLDGVRDLDVARALHGRSRPAIATCRPLWEGGRFDGGEEVRQRILIEALQRGAEYVDIEWRSLGGAAGYGGFDSLLHSGEHRIVLSSHDFSGMSSGLSEQVRAMRGTGAAVIKVAVTPARLSDTLPLREVGRGGDAVVIGMGNAGVATRLLATRFGSRWTYGGNGVAPGQVPSARMLREFRFRTISDRTLLYGVVGDDVMGSLSPVMHNAAFEAAGLDAVCVPLSTTDFDDFLTFADAMGIAGAVVTTPFEHSALATSVRAEDATQRRGVANTVRRTADGWEATYTATPEGQWEWWTGRCPEPGVMHAAALAETSHRATKAQSGESHA